MYEGDSSSSSEDAGDGEREAGGEAAGACASRSPCLCAITLSRVSRRAMFERVVGDGTVVARGSKSSPTGAIATVEAASEPPTTVAALEAVEAVEAEAASFTGGGLTSSGSWLEELARAALLTAVD